ncbi:MAG: aminoacyl-tRNA hydrolase [Pseudomonadota bacterium]|nr:aminoacyl-tRNA hydrolase [Pseudomonadota bacterium]MBU1398180.1 aminoacyl-tRNA hydrolase [Pseudomonadota bacterium]
MSGKNIRLVAGLGNPGDAYAKTRHNIGFMVVDALSGEFSIPVEKKKFDASYGRGVIEGIEVILVKPMAFMNRSGPPIQSLSGYYKISCDNMLIIYDDVDLAFGRLKINEKGGFGGHKGMKSIIDSFGDEYIPRLRMGVGRSEAGINTSDHVLGRFSNIEKDLLDQIIKRARDAVVKILCNGITEGMNRFNENKTIT